MCFFVLLFLNIFFNILVPNPIKTDIANLLMGPYQIILHRITVDLRVSALIDYSKHPRSPEQEFCYQMYFGVILRTHPIYWSFSFEQSTLSAQTTGLSLWWKWRCTSRFQCSHRIDNNLDEKNHLTLFGTKVSSLKFSSNCAVHLLGLENLVSSILSIVIRARRDRFLPFPRTLSWSKRK